MSWLFPPESAKELGSAFVDGALQSFQERSDDLRAEWVDQIVNGTFDKIDNLRESLIADLEALAPTAVEKSVEAAIDTLDRKYKNLNWRALAKDLAPKLSQATKTLTKEINLEETFQNLATISDIFFKNFDLETRGKKAGQEFAKGFAEASDPVINKMGEAEWKLIKRSALPIVAASTLAFGVPLALYYCYKRLEHNIGKPKLATTVKQTTLLTPLYQRVTSTYRNIFGKSQEKKRKAKAIFNRDLTRQIDTYGRILKNTAKNGGVFQNLLLHGPGGTGKTMIAKELAEASGMDFIMMSGGDLAQFIKRGEHVTEMNNLMNHVKSAKKPTILFIDEVESLAADRGRMDRSQLLELQNAFLSHTGEPSNKMTIIAATNRMQDIDEAVLNRFDRKLLVAAPQKRERAKIIRQYAKQFFSNEEIREHFNSEQIHSMASATEGFTGRTLFKLINGISGAQKASDDNELTQTIIQETLDDFVEQEKLVRGV